MSLSLRRFFRRLLWVACSPFVLTGIVGLFVLGQDEQEGDGDGLGELLAANVIWLILLFSPVLLVGGLVYWLATGKSLL